MKTYIRRSLMLFVAMLFAITAGLPAAQAANHRASCVGILVSTQAPAGDLDVNDYKAIAAGDGVVFGQFVSFGAQLHEGSYWACVPR